MSVFKKKRRMEFARPGERRRREDQEQLDNQITRRVFLMRGAMGAGFLALGGKLWRMQIAEGNTFRETAEDLRTRAEILKAPRGRVLDRAGQPLAENRRSWSIEIVRSRLPEDETQRQRVLDEVSTSLQLKQTLVLDRALVPMGSEAAIINQLSKQLKVDVPALIARLNSSTANVEILAEELTPEQAVEWQSKLADIPGVRVMGSLEYQLAVHDSDDLPMTVKKDVDRDTALMIASNSVYLPGVIVDDSTLIREYLAGEHFSHILGYVGPITEEEFEAQQSPNGAPIYEPNDYVGKGGIEQALERDLRGEKGGRVVQVDAAGVIRFELADRRREPVGGLSARLTVIRDFQNQVAAALADGIRVANEAAQKATPPREQVGAGVAIAMNPKNGEILAISSLPTFDNQKFVSGISQADYEFLVDKKNFEPLLDRSISGLFPPGSTFKPMVAAIALQEGVVTKEKTFSCKGNISVPWTWDEAQRTIYPCWEKDIGHGDVDMLRGISESCDVYFYNLGAPYDIADNGVPVHYYIPGDPQSKEFSGLGIERMHDYMTKVFGYGKATGIELAGESDGLMPTPNWLFQTIGENWSIGDTINVSIGQGHLLCTPLQLVNSTAAIANGGKLYRPRLIKDLIRDDGTVVTTFKPDVIRDIARDPGNDKQRWIKPEHLQIVREGMLRTVSEGTGKDRISVNGVTIAAKSGTAEYGEAVDGKYKQGHAWFTAFGPYEDPEIVVGVLIVGGGPGSEFAGPVTNQIMNAYFGNQAIRDAAKS